MTVKNLLEKPPGSESLTMSAMQGRLMVAALSVVSFWASAESWLAKVGPYLADGVTAAEAMDALQSAGPMLSAWNDVWTMAASAAAFGFAVWSKAKDWWRSRRPKQ
jgi:hypothetical protein